MDPDIVATLLARELRALRREIAAYPDDASLWLLPEGIANAGGTLAHHITGNLRHFIGARLGGSGYERDRAAEFERRDLGRDELIALVDAAAEEVARAFDALAPDDLDRAFPDPLAASVATSAFLLHLLTHTAYHLGQVDYHRRFVTGSGVTVNALSAKEIPAIRPEGA
jgi:uncharacterized damage-inducible protein DinB